jgi:membrane fusion protein (multidrug efflux system)
MKTLLQTALLSCLFLTACQKNNVNSPSPAGPASNKNGFALQSVEGFIAKPTELSEGVTASGSLIPGEETELHPEASGRVVLINLPEGKLVKKGELLVKVFDDDLKTEIDKTDTQLKQAQITAQRLSELLKSKGVSQQEYDLAALQVQTLTSELDLLKINKSKTELRAPYDGILGLRKISPGAYVSPANAVATIRSTNTLKLDFAVPEKYSNQLHIGQTVNFTTEGNPTRYQATVAATEQSISVDSRNLQVRAIVKGNSSALLPGNFAEVSLNLGNKPKALMIPNQALIPQARDKKIIVSKNGKAQFVIVKTGIRQSDLIEIVSGLEPGDTVAITGILFLRPDAPVKFSKVQ